MSSGTLPSIRIDRATQNESVYDVVMAISECTQAHVMQMFTRLVRQYPEFIPSKGKVIKLRINCVGRETPVADAIEIAYILPGQPAAAFRRARALGGDLSLIEEIEQRHRHMIKGPEQHFMLNSRAGSSPSISSRSLIWDLDKFEYCRSTMKKDADGYFHAATSPLVCAIKIGMWKDDVPALRSRYVGYYGQELELWVFAAEDYLGETKRLKASLESVLDKHVATEERSKGLGDKMVDEETRAASEVGVLRRGVERAEKTVKEKEEAPWGAKQLAAGLLDSLEPRLGAP